MEDFLSSTFGVFIAEIGDKTQLLTLFLAARFAQKNAVIAGIFAATLLNHLVSAWLGVWLAASVSPVLVKWIVGLSFIAVGLWLLKPDKDDDGDNGGRWLKYGAFAATLVLFSWPKSAIKRKSPPCCWPPATTIWHGSCQAASSA